MNPTATLTLKCLNKPIDAAFGKGSCEIVVFEKSIIKITDFQYDLQPDIWKTGSISYYNLYGNENKFIPEYFVVKFEVHMFKIL